MTYSTRNPAYGRLMRLRADLRVQQEADLANQIQGNEPGLQRDEALRREER